VRALARDRQTRRGWDSGATRSAAVSRCDASITRPRRKHEPGKGPRLTPIPQPIQSILWTRKDLLTLKRHSARTLQDLRERILARLCCLAAAITLDHQPGRPSGAL
jgi:hypothetical protein